MAGDRRRGGAPVDQHASGMPVDQHAGGTPAEHGARGLPADSGAGGARGRHWSGYDDARTAVVRDVLRAAVATLVAQAGRARLDIVDAGGGTGGFAVPLAGMGHTVTVVDPSPDSLAAAQRRAAEMDVPLVAVQGDVADLAGVVGEQSADLVLCHSVLEYVDSPADAMAAIAQVLRPGGAVSVLAASAVAAVIHRALAGRFDDARRLLTGISTGTSTGIDADPGTGTSQPCGAGPGRARRFTMSGAVALIEGAGLRAGSTHGVRVFADLVPGMFADADPGAADALVALEQAASGHPAFHDIATQFHILGYR